MLNFLKDSIRELKHVVWPTRKETQDYFVIVTVVLILFGLYLFSVSTIFSEGLTQLGKIVGGNTTQTVSEYPINVEGNTIPAVEVEVPSVDTSSVEAPVKETEK